MASNYTAGRFQGFDSSGDPLDGGLLYTYAAGTTTPLATYTTQAGSVANANPVVLDATGRKPVWLSAASYRFILKTSAGVTVTDDDNIVGAVSTADLSASTGSASVGHIATGTGSVATTVAAKLRVFKSPLDTGATLDGVADDTAELQALIDSGAKTIHITGPIKHGPITVTTSVHLIFDADAVVTPVFDTSTTQTLYLVSAADVVIEGLRIDSYAATNSANKYIVRTTTGGDNFTLLRPVLRDLTASDGTTGLTNLLVTHAVYLENVTGARVIQGEFDNISGAAIFMKTLTDFELIGNRINDTGWYSINADHTCYDGLISGNRISGTSVTCRYWGGSVNLQSSTNGSKNQRIKVLNNHFSGVHNYGSVIRAQSVEDCIISGNTFEEIEYGTLLTDPVYYVSISRRGTAEGSPENGPCVNVVIANNVMRAGPGNNYAIYLQNQYIATRSPHDNIIIESNVVQSVDTSNYFGAFCIVHGFKAGMRRVRIANNTATVYGQSGTPGGGALGVLSTNADGLIDDIMITGNSLTEITTATPDQSYHLGVYVQASTSNILVRGNTFRNFRYGLRVASAIENLQGANDNVFIGCLNDALIQTTPSGSGFDMSIGSALPVTGVYRVGHMRQNPAAAASASFGWVCTTAGGAMTAVYAGGATYVAGVWYRNAAGRVYELITAGGGVTATEPTGTTVGTTETAADGYAWMCRDTASARWATLPALGAAVALP